jgi:uncharacterized protein
MIQLSEIWIYPVKSLGGIQLQQSQVTDRGLEYDHRWLLVDENGQFLSQRNYPELALFLPKIKNDFLTITHRTKLENIAIPLRSTFLESEIKIQVTVWDDVVNAFEVSLEATDWFSRMLGFDVRLVYMPDESQRKVDPEYAVSGNEINSFSDGYPFLIIGQASLNDLNLRLKNPVSMNRFRPNFVFTGALAYAEEIWREITIGKVTFFGVKPCGRCIMTTVDQDLGTKSSKDPLLTLSKYKKLGNKVIFGQNLVGSGVGMVAVGDFVKTL